jgi:hypothetical protein
MRPASDLSRLLQFHLHPSGGHRPAQWGLSRHVVYNAGRGRFIGGPLSTGGDVG